MINCDDNDEIPKFKNTRTEKYVLNAFTKYRKF